MVKYVVYIYIYIHTIRILQRNVHIYIYIYEIYMYVHNGASSIFINQQNNECISYIIHNIIYIYIIHIKISGHVIDGSIDR